MKRQTKTKLIGFTAMLAIFLLVNKFFLNERFGWDLILTGVVILLPVTLLFKLPERQPNTRRQRSGDSLN